MVQGVAWTVERAGGRRFTRGRAEVASGARREKTRGACLPPYAYRTYVSLWRGTHLAPPVRFHLERVDFIMEVVVVFHDMPAILLMARPEFNALDMGEKLGLGVGVVQGLMGGRCARKKSGE